MFEIFTVYSITIHSVEGRNNNNCVNAECSCANRSTPGNNNNKAKLSLFAIGNQKELEQYYRSCLFPRGFNRI